MELKDKVLIRKPLDAEQLEGKIVTSDYLVSAVTIHSSVLKTLGWIDKVYRSKTSTATYSNVREVKRMKKLLGKLKTKVGNFTPYVLNKISEGFVKYPNFIEMIKDKQLDKWESQGTPSIFLNNFKTPKQLLSIEQNHNTFDKIFENELLEDVAFEYKGVASMKIKEIVPILCDYLEKIKTDSIKKHTQTLIYEKELAFQNKLENELGKGFTVKQYANTLDNWKLDEIQRKWHIDLLNYNGSWNDLTDYLYSPTMIAEIRNELNVKVRSKSKFTNRKGVESSEKKKLEKIINRKKRLLGDKDEFENKYEQLKNKLELSQLKYEEAKLLGNSEIEKLRQKYYYNKRCLEKFNNENKKKIEAYDELKKAERKHGLIIEMMNETRSGEEISLLEQEETIKSIKKVKAEKEIPYFTWRFVCDKMDRDTASKIEQILEDKLNKGGGVGGEDGYINVTAFPMTQSYEFFVDYPKNSNLFRAFRKKGIELSNILIEGVAQHLKTSFVHCKGETYFNNPMSKTLNGDMLDWIGV